MRFKRFVTQYRRRGDDSLVAAYPVKRTRVQELRALFPEADEDVVLSQPITQAQRAFFEERTGHSLDLRRFAYFLEPFVNADVGRNGTQPPRRSRSGRMHAAAD